MKKYFCKHNIALSIKFKDFIITDVTKSGPLNQKKGKEEGQQKTKVGGLEYKYIC